MYITDIHNLYKARSVVRKQASYVFYRPSAEVLASIIVDIPVKLVVGTYFNIILYFLSGLATTASESFIFFLFVFVTTLAMPMVFLPPYPNLTGDSFICPVPGSVAGETFVNGDAWLETSYDYSYSHLWRNLGIILGFLLFFLFTYLLASEHNVNSSTGPDVLVFRRGSLPSTLAQTDLKLKGRVDAERPPVVSSAPLGGVVNEAVPMQVDRETFSLRKPLDVPKSEKLTSVEEITRLLNMDDFADAVVGLPVKGLNVEQRKRLSIGVELAGKPALLLLLDEPTSGLDSQSSEAILALLWNLAAGGLSTLCTINQPSAMLF
ncbi:hypothetical protein FOMG_19624 [Fusarium oxysporum f. sp. melonis 26406]|uniref:ABC transporter domain-containing protein n=1 Tax=Fusarium oxysporum f. sp. melonis 26406 TaxID=1089452 RepID=W9YWS8_FUSOX|nr:hypothetical protein FOMG_19624 [Fusarium oxysporum f. sp. melonis 26406]